MPETIKLLIVDDEPATRKLLATILGRMGHSVRTAQDGFSALQQIRDSVPDVLLSDLHMPGMSGFELLSVVRRRLPEIYVIASSGAYEGEDVPFGIAADAFYAKATGFQSLIRMMESATTSARPHSRDVTASVPVWVSLADDEPLCDAFVTICCPDCMRSFSHAVEDSRLLIHETGCTYCETTIRYAVVEPLDPATSQPFHPKLVKALTPLIADDRSRQEQTGIAKNDRMMA